nr:MAG TPA: hypothetical protein [Caudoviricetes sp.]
MIDYLVEYVNAGHAGVSFRFGLLRNNNSIPYDKGVWCESRAVTRRGLRLFRRESVRGGA